ncbi:hypothetical protein HMPREF2141_00767, partial [Bacteroides uniformis]
ILLHLQVEFSLFLIIVMPVLYMLLLQQVICPNGMVASLCFINALLKGLLYMIFL